MAQAQLSDLLSNRTLARLERHRLAVGANTSQKRGERLSKGRGRSTDFSDYRNYVAGDDIRYVDWNIYARLRRPYVKLFLEEEERHLTLLVDDSASMGFDGKLQRAKQLAAALGTVGLVGPERVSLYAAGEGHPCRLKPCAGRRSLPRLLAAIDQLEAGGPLMIEEAVNALVEHHKGRGLAVIVSDFLTTGDLTAPLNALASSGVEIWAVQVLGASEADPALDGDLRLLDSETGATIDVSSVGQLLEIYHEVREGLQRWLEQNIRRRGGRFLSTISDDDLDQLLFDRMQRHGWLLAR